MGARKKSILSGHVPAAKKCLECSETKYLQGFPLKTWTFSKFFAFFSLYIHVTKTCIKSSVS